LRATSDALFTILRVPWLEVGGRWIEVSVRESSRAQLTRVVVHADGIVEVVVPKRTPLRAVDAMLLRHRDWIEKHVARSHVRKLGLQRDDVVWVHGEPRPLPDVRSVEQWYRAHAREQVEATVTREAARLRIEHGRITIRDQRTRWGSCSSRGNLSFNWRLVVAPVEVLEYVVVHELCHVREHNHSRAYWRLLERSRPTWAEEKRWLDEHGPELLAYRVPERMPLAA
jgi:predicted metal-dependent hydrolase